MAQAEFVAELLLLYRASGRPSYRRISTEIRDNDAMPDSVSHETIAALLSGYAIPRWSKVEVIVRQLATMAVHRPDPDAEVRRFFLMWQDAYSATTPTSPPPTPTSPPPTPNFQPRRTVLAGGSGYRIVHGRVDDGFVAAEIHRDQYSVNWQTDLGPTSFMALWRRTGPVRLAVCFPDAELLDMDALEARAFIGDEQPGLNNATLIRVWFTDVSVAWQRFFNEGPAVIGVASDTFDREVVEQYLYRTASSAALSFAANVANEVESVESLRMSTLPTLRKALGVGQ